MEIRGAFFLRQPLNSPKILPSKGQTFGNPIDQHTAQKSKLPATFPAHVGGGENGGFLFRQVNQGTLSTNPAAVIVGGDERAVGHGGEGVAGVVLVLRRRRGVTAELPTPAGFIEPEAGDDAAATDEAGIGAVENMGGG